MRPILLLLLSTMPAAAAGEPRAVPAAPGTACEAPVLVQAAGRRLVSDSDPLPPPFRLAMLTCADRGVPQRPPRRT